MWVCRTAFTLPRKQSSSQKRGLRAKKKKTIISVCVFLSSFFPAVTRLNVLLNLSSSNPQKSRKKKRAFFFLPPQYTSRLNKFQQINKTDMSAFPDFFSPPSSFLLFTRVIHLFLFFFLNVCDNVSGVDASKMKTQHKREIMEENENERW